MPASPPQKVPARFQVGRRTLLMDRFMNQFINVGGVSVIVAVFGIFVFILIQILPLFQGAEVEPGESVQLEPRDYQALGIDEWSELPFLLEPDGDLRFVDLAGDRGVFARRLPFVEEHGFGAARYEQRIGKLAAGTRDGRFSIVDIRYRPEYPEGGERRIVVDVEPGPLLRIGPEGAPVEAIAYGDDGARKLVAAVQRAGGRQELHAVTLSQRRSLMGTGRTVVDGAYNLTELVEGRIERILAASEANSLLVSNEAGEVFYLFFDGGEFYLRQRLSPFADLEDPGLALIDYVFGDMTFVAVSPSGEVRGFSLYHHAEQGKRLFGQTKQFASLDGPADVYAGSVRNKAFLVGSDREIRLLYSTTEAVRWEGTFDSDIRLAAIGGKYDALAFVDASSRLRIYELRDPHPEASLRAFFGKLWYEGASEPKYEWQSTGGADDFEPKLSLVPLIFGSLKGTLYAMLFAVPIALLAALYTSQFVKPEIKTVVKPVMEIMASLPSVVLGFLGALWLAPILETRVPSVMMVAAILPPVALLCGWGRSKLPPRVRRRLPAGYEFAVFAPIMLAAGWIAWELGPLVERAFFTVADPATGRTVADFRLWWPQATGAPFEQRNSLVVGFMMGFAVIPIIFTIAEDALSNVPQSLRSGSLALGASRWQTAMRIVVPTASAGIFSALMIGLGRAVGETMIVVMATGNTPIMEWNVFSGMRTLSANIAVELPEAPHHGTLYRTLFLGAMALFVMTFAVNTAAEVMRQNLRERYKMVE